MIEDDMKHNIELTTSQVQYVRAAIGCLRNSANYPKNDRHFGVSNKEVMNIFTQELRPLVKRTQNKQ